MWANSFHIQNHYMFFIFRALIRKEPEKLLIVTTWNIRNKQMFDMWQNNWEIIISLFQTCNLVELSNNKVIGQ